MRTLLVFTLLLFTASIPFKLEIFHVSPALEKLQTDKVTTAFPFMPF